MASRKQPMEKASNPKDSAAAAAAATTFTPRRTFFTEGPPDPIKHYMVPVNDSKTEEILTFFTSNDPNRGAAFKFCAVYGHRQGGKSTRLAEIKRKLKEKNLVVEVDTRLLSETTEGFYASLAFQIALNLGIESEKIPQPKGREEFQQLFQGKGVFVTTTTEQKKIGFILLFEEMDGLLCKEQFWSALSPLLETNQKELDESQKESRGPRFPNILRGVIGVGVHRIVRDSNPGSTSSPPNKKRDILVPHFTKEQVDTHLWQPAERDYNFKLTDDAKELLFEFIRGHPGLTCRAGTKILAFITSKQTSSIPFSFTRSHAISILHRMILNSRHESPLNDMVMALQHQFQSGKTLKQVLRSILFDSERPEVSSDEDELYYAIDKGLLRLEVSEDQQRVDEPTGYVDFECPIILHALLPRIFPEAKRSFKKRNDTIDAVKNLPREFHTILKGFIHQINIDTLQGGSQKTQKRLAYQMDCSEKIPVEAAYHFQFYFFLEKALRKDGFSVLAELHPWKVKGQERRRIDLYVDGNAYHFGIELAAGIENSKYKTYLERTDAYRVGFNDKHAFFVLFTTIPRNLWSELWKGVENQAYNEAGTGVFSFIVSHDSQFVDWAIYGYNIREPIKINRDLQSGFALRLKAATTVPSPKRPQARAAVEKIVGRKIVYEDPGDVDDALKEATKVLQSLDMTDPTVPPQVVTPSALSAGSTRTAPPAGPRFKLNVKIPGEKWLTALFCDDPNETFGQLLLRVQKKHPNAKGCTAVLDGKEEARYDPEDTIHFLESGATVVLAAD